MALILPKGLPVINKLLDEGIDVIYKEDFKKEFFKLFGFGLEGVDYSEDVDITTV